MGKTNAKEEFLTHTQRVLSMSPNASLFCCQIRWGDEYSGEPEYFYLTTGFTNDEYQKFLSNMDFEYDSGYGGQELFGTIWYKDGTWSERGEYDGSEWWRYQKCPEIPNEIFRKDKVREERIDKII